MGPLGIGEAGIGELGQRLTPPEPECFTECSGRRLVITLVRKAPTLGHQLLEANGIDVAGCDGQGVTGFRREDRRRAEGTAELADLCLQGIGRIRRLPVLPQRIDEPFGPDRLSPMQRQQGQQGPLFGAADWHHLAALHHLELAEEPDLHPFTVRPSLRGCRTGPW